MLSIPLSRSLLPVLAVLGLLVEERSNEARGQEEAPAPRVVPSAPDNPPLPPATSLPTAGAKPYPINLPTAMKLANARGLDIELASRRLQAAGAELQRAHVLWLPNLIFGTDYYRHDGQIQDIAGNVFGTSKQGFMIGGAPYAVFAFADAIFSPLAVRQTVDARKAQVQAAANDTLLAVTQAYFNVQQARGEMAGALDATRFADDLLRRLDKLAPSLVPALELHRGKVLAARLRQARLQGERSWRTASAELLRVLYLDPTLVVEPLEPPHLRVSMLALDRPVDDLIPVALTNRPELAAQQALVKASLQLMRQEKMRPLIPSLLLRGFSTPVTGTLGAGYFGGGLNGNLGNFSVRQDWDVQVLWTLQNFGFGNRALVKQRTEENKAALVESFRVQDRVAAEVVQAYAEAQTAEGRIREAETELREAQELVRQDLEALGQTQQRGGAGPIILIVRPQEVVAAIQSLQQAYADYYASIADCNRAQFQLYRALGQPAQFVSSLDRDPPGCPACPQSPPLAMPGAAPGPEAQAPLSAPRPAR